MCIATTYECIKLLLATKQAYVSGWNGVVPTITPGFGLNVPRPSIDEVRYARELGYKDKRRVYQAEYRRKNKERIAAYFQANKERTYAARNALQRAKTALKHSGLANAEPIKTRWVQL
jgi:hypothetical protein